MTQAQAPEIQVGVPIDTYHADGAVSSTGLKVLHSQCPRLYYEQYESPSREPREATEAMVLGNAVHSAVLEPELFPLHYAVAPKVDRRTKAGKATFAEFQAANLGKTILTGDQGRVVDGVLAELRDSMDPAAVSARDLLWERLGTNESSVWWTDEETGIRCRCRPDRWLEENALVSFKTTKDASPKGFARQIAQLNYHLAEAFYLDGCEEATGERPWSVWFVAVQTSPPYLFGVYKADEELIAVGEADYRSALKTLAECRDLNEWPGFPVGNASLPAWRVAEAEVAA